MSTAPVSITYAAPQAAIHYSTRFGRNSGPVLCKSSAMNTPATSEPRYVNCPACLQLMTPAQREERANQVELYR